MRHPKMGDEARRAYFREAWDHAERELAEELERFFAEGDSAELFRIAEETEFWARRAARYDRLFGGRS